jgi:hypothetical protein
VRIPSTTTTEKTTMQIAPCRAYHAQTVGQSLLRMPDGKSVFKVYYIVSHTKLAAYWNRP